MTHIMTEIILTLHDTHHDRNNVNVVLENTSVGSITDLA